MKAPAFWESRGWRSTLLLPAAEIYCAVGRFLRNRKAIFRASVPVICVGNLTAGGTGKTPMVIKILQKFSENGVLVHAVSRGYGGSEVGPLAVEVGTHEAAQVGDEPLLIASYAPTWIARNRAAGVRAAIEGGAQAVVLDDGFQNPSVEKDLSLIVVDAGYGFGNRRCIPAGPLRERVEEGMARADALVLIGEPDNPWPDEFHGKSVLRAVFEPRFSGISLEGARVLAFAGIGRPEKFFDTVRQQGATIVDSETFPDHYVYSRSIIERLIARAEAQDLMLVTTEKDAIKLPRDTLGKIWPLPVDLVFDDQSALDRLLSVFTTHSQ